MFFITDGKTFGSQGPHANTNVCAETRPPVESAMSCSVLPDRVPSFTFNYLDGRAANPFPKKSGAGRGRRRKKETGSLHPVQTRNRIEQRVQVSRRFAAPATR